MTTIKESMDPIFSPRSIAIIGASDKGGYPSRILKNLLKYDYKGKIYPINPKRETVQGLPCYPSLTQIQGEVDLAVVIISRNIVMKVLKDCADKNVKGVIIITSGFDEADGKGKELHQELENFCQEHPHIQVIGPNCAGLANIKESIVLTLLEPDPLPGEVAFISQSGALMMSSYGMFTDKGVGLSYIASTGNQVDVEISDLIHYALEDPDTKVVATFIEGLTDGDKFLAVADHALQKRKPLIALKIGRTAEGAKAAGTHTGSMTGADEVFDAVFKQKGIIRVDDLEELVDVALVFSSMAHLEPKGDGIGIISQSGGMASLTADFVMSQGLKMPQFSEVTQERLIGMDHLLTFGIMSNPADVRGAGTKAGTLAKTIQPILEDEGIHLGMILLARSAVNESDVATAQEIGEICKNTHKPIFVVWPGRRIPDRGVDLESTPYRILERSHIPLFSSSLTCVKAMKKYIDYYSFRKRHLGA